MNKINRLQERLKQEGLLKTVQYLGCASYDSARCLARDIVFDFVYSGRLLANGKTQFKHLGANDVYHSDYDALRYIFDYCCPIDEQDVLVDVGCGKGRVLNYWLSRGLKNRMIGLELDPEIAAHTARQFKNRPNVSVIAGDAIGNLPPDGTLFYFYNPFEKAKVAEFEKRLTSFQTNLPVKVIYYNPKSVDVFSPERWHIEQLNFEQDLGIIRWGRINKFHDLAILQQIC